MNTEKSVILIDDCEIDNFITTKLLEFHGITKIQSFNQSTLAFSHLAKIKIPPSYMFIDMNMPVMNGIEFVKKIKELDHFHSTKLIVTTASINPNDKLIVEELNCGFIEKPLTHQIILKILNSSKLT